jgi:hypothetical protein
MIIDTHLHLIYRDRLTYPWLKDVPALDADFTWETYAREARRLGTCSVVSSPPAGRKILILPPISKPSAPIPSSRASAACCTSFPMMCQKARCFGRM